MGSPNAFFPCKTTNLATRGRKLHNFETATDRNVKFRIYMENTWIILCGNFGGNRSRDRVSEPIRGLNSSSSNTNCKRRIKVSNLEAPGNPVSAPKLGRFRHLFIYLFKNFFRRCKDSETTTARKFKFGDMISLYMKLCTCIFGGATSSGLGQMHQKLVITKFDMILVTDFCHL